MRIKLDLTQEETERLIEAAVRDRRPVHFEAEVLLRRALGLPDKHFQPAGETGPCSSK